MWPIILSPLKKIWSWLALAGMGALWLLQWRKRAQQTAELNARLGRQEKEIGRYLAERIIEREKAKNAVETQTKNAAATADDVAKRLRDKWSRD